MTQEERTHVVQRVGAFVHAAVQQLCDAELLSVPSHLVRGAAQDVVRLRGGAKRHLATFSMKKKRRRQKNEKQLTILLLMDGVKKLSLALM